MTRPLRFASLALYTDKRRWPHAVVVDAARHVFGRRGAPKFLGTEVVAWLRENTPRGGWRFVTRALADFPAPQDPDRFQVWFAHEDDAFAFRMRWT